MTSCYSIVKNGIYLNKAKTNISYLVIIIDLREKCLVFKWGLLLSEYMNRLSKSVSQYFSNHHLVFVLSNKNMVFFQEKNLPALLNKDLKEMIGECSNYVYQLEEFSHEFTNKLLRGGGNTNKTNNMNKVQKNYSGCPRVLISQIEYSKTLPHQFFFILTIIITVDSVSYILVTAHDCMNKEQFF